MLIARLHRGGLHESMKTAKTFNSLDQMKEWFVESHNNAFSKEDIVIEKNIIFDNRIGWKTQHVCVNKYGEEDYIAKYGYPQCIGMCDLNYNNN